MDKQIDPNVLALAQAFMATMKAGDAASTPTATYGHGPGGIFSAPMNPELVNAMVLPSLGLIGRLPVRASVEWYPLDGIITGVTAGSGSNPTGVCDPWPVAGNLKLIKTTQSFGRFGISTDTINLTDPLIGGIVNRGEFQDFRLAGNPLQNLESKVVPSLPNSDFADIFTALGKEMFETTIEYFRRYARKDYTGNPANNVYQGSKLVYGEPVGIDLLINTGWQDAETKTWSPAADSLIVNLNVNITGNGDTYVTTLTNVYRRQAKRAADTGLAPVKFAFVMPSQMFYELTAVWPCAYNTSRCAANAVGATVFVDGRTERQDVEAMRSGKYLLIDDEKVEVILDDAIAENESSGTFTSTIYMVPLVYQGNKPGMWVDYFNFDNPQAVQMRNAFGAPGEFKTLNNGRFFWIPRKNGACVSADLVEMHRIMLKVPFLAARITNVKYTPQIQMVSGWPTDTTRFYNGGDTTRRAPSFYSPNVYAGY